MGLRRRERAFVRGPQAREAQFPPGIRPLVQVPPAASRGERTDRHERQLLAPAQPTGQGGILSYSYNGTDRVRKLHRKSDDWYVLHVKPRHEKRVSTVLRMKGMEELLPLYSETRRWSDRVQRVDLPVFPCYVFCRLKTGARRVEVLRLASVRSIIGFGGSPVPVETTEINMVRTIVQSGLPTQPWPGLSRGQRVRVVGGPLTGCEGVVERRRGAHRLIVAVSLLQRSIAVEIDADWAVPLDTRGRNGNSFAAPTRWIC